MSVRYLSLLTALHLCSVIFSSVYAQGHLNTPSGKPLDQPTLMPLANPRDFIFPSAPSKADAIQSEQAREIKSGLLLVATERLQDESLHGAVILVVRHLTSGSRGIVLNRPTPLVLGEIRLDLAGEPGDNARVHFGGPDNARQVRYLLKGPRSHSAEARLADNVWFGTREDALKTAATRVSGRHLRLYAGHVSWAPGELKQQVDRGDWLLAKAMTANVFSHDIGGLWERLLKVSRHNDLVNVTDEGLIVK